MVATSIRILPAFLLVAGLALGQTPSRQARQMSNSTPDQRAASPAEKRPSLRDVESYWRRQQREKEEARKEAWRASRPKYVLKTPGAAPSTSPEPAASTHTLFIPDSLPSNQENSLGTLVIPKSLGNAPADAQAGSATSKPDSGPLPYWNANAGMLKSPAGGWAQLLGYDLKLAEDEMVKGNFEGALELLNKTVSSGQHLGRAYALRSGVLGNLQRHPEGITDANLGIEHSTSPNDKALAAYNKCFNLTQLAKNIEALKACALSVQLNPKYSRAHFGLGKLYHKLHMGKEAARALDRAIELNPKLAAAWAYRAEIYFEQKAKEKGMLAAEKAIELNPSDPRGFIARAKGFAANNQYEEMLADATRAVELEPSRPGVHLLKASALRMLGRRNDASSEYEAETDRKALLESSEFQRHLVEIRVLNGTCHAGRMDFDTPGNLTTVDLVECMKEVTEALAGTQPANRPFDANKLKTPSLPLRIPSEH